MAYFWESLATLGTHQASLQVSGLLLDLFFVAGRQAVELLIVGLLINQQQAGNGSANLHQSARGQVLNTLINDTLANAIMPECAQRIVELIEDEGQDKVIFVTPE